RSVMQPSERRRGGAVPVSGAARTAPNSAAAETSPPRELDLICGFRCLVNQQIGQLTNWHTIETLLSHRWHSQRCQRWRGTLLRPRRITDASALATGVMHVRGMFRRVPTVPGRSLAEGEGWLNNGGEGGARRPEQAACRRSCLPEGDSSG